MQVIVIISNSNTIISNPRKADVEQLRQMQQYEIEATS